MGTWRREDCILLGNYIATCFSLGLCVQYYLFGQVSRKNKGGQEGNMTGQVNDVERGFSGETEGVFWRRNYKATTLSKCKTQRHSLAGNVGFNIQGDSSRWGLGIIASDLWTTEWKRRHPVRRVHINGFNLKARGMMQKVGKNYKGQHSLSCYITILLLLLILFLYSAYHVCSHSKVNV